LLYFLVLSSFPRSSLFPYTTLFRSDHGHRLGAVDHERAARGQPHLAIERLLDLLGDAKLVERVTRALVALDALEQIGCDGTKIGDRKSTRLNSSHVKISYAVFCLKK